eukprot:gnl/Spiro4/26446_TR13152_c0_g1_i1.p1 gnl/Spiro4/26446_TR13152_c0_g1~~gnl/Spiro4/26446_TR13152_c0_g1_i1.p1  ORF type:complete len:500 (+),score=99.10 gnl/Spiro4/26446_TR13152_c0_g1_i1:92-1591(+)
MFVRVLRSVWSAQLQLSSFPSIINSTVLLSRCFCAPSSGTPHPSSTTTTPSTSSTNVNFTVIVDGNAHANPASDLSAVPVVGRSGLVRSLRAKLENDFAHIFPHKDWPRALNIFGSFTLPQGTELWHEPKHEFAGQHNRSAFFYQTPPPPPVPHPADGSSSLHGEAGPEGPLHMRLLKYVTVRPLRLLDMTVRTDTTISSYDDGKHCFKDKLVQAVFGPQMPLVSQRPASPFPMRHWSAEQRDVVLAAVASAGFDGWLSAPDFFVRRREVAIFDTTHTLSFIPTPEAELPLVPMFKSEALSIRTVAYCLAADRRYPEPLRHFAEIVARSALGTGEDEAEKKVMRIMDKIVSRDLLDFGPEEVLAWDAKERHLPALTANRTPPSPPSSSSSSPKSSGVSGSNPSAASASPPPPPRDVNVMFEQWYVLHYHPRLPLNSPHDMFALAVQCLQELQRKAEEEAEAAKAQRQGKEEDDDDADGAERVEVEGVSVGRNNETGAGA